MRRGTLVVISGPSGVGKGTIVKEIRRLNENIKLSVSATTRAPRPEDTEGVTYFFKTKAEFEEMIARGEFLEYAVYNNNYYGTPMKAVDEMLAAGFDVVLEIEVQGGLQIMERRPDAAVIFLAAPSFAELERRLRDRGDTSEEDIVRRVATAHWEYTQAPKYQYIVENDIIDECANEVLSIITAEKCRAKYQLYLVKETD